MEQATSLLDAFVNALAASPSSFAHVRTTTEPAKSERSRIDAVVEAEVAGKRLVLLVEAKHTAYPRDVRQAVWQLRAYQAKAHKGDPTEEIVPVIIAEAISPSARETLRSEGVGYFDRGGSLYLPVHGAFIFVDKPPPKSEARAFGSVFKGQKAQVLQTVFLNRGDWITVKDIAAKTGVSSTTVSQTLSDLERREWMQVRGSGPSKLRHLINPSGLLDAWAKFLSVQKQPPQRRYFVAASNDDLLHRLSATCERRKAIYAVTGEAAAQIYSPFLSSVSQVVCRMLAGEATVGALADMQARAVNEGWNLAVIESRSPVDFKHAETKNGVRLASPLQVYLDLLQGTGRSKEMAEHIRREKLAT